MRFGLNSWTTGDDVDLLTDIRVAAEAGYDCVEARDAKIERLLDAGTDFATIRRAMQRAGVRMLSVSTLEQATLAEGLAHESLVARCEVLCRYAQELDAPCVIVGPSYCEGADMPPPDQMRARTVRSLAAFGEAAAPFGTRIAFEFHGYRRASVNTLAEARHILDSLSEPSVGLVIDAFHFYVGGSDAMELRSLPSGQLAIVHLADVDHNNRTTLGKSNRVLPGTGVMPLSAMLDGIRAAGYEGAYSLELFRPDYWAMDPSVVARAGIESMRSVLSP